jgi:hypothetical protein
MSDCRNCGNPLSSPFCPECGQKSTKQGLSFKQVFADIMNYMFSVESPLWKTFGTLWTNPGKIGREFISGKRTSYYRPFQYYIFAIVIHLLVGSLFNYDPVDVQMRMTGVPEDAPAQAVRMTEAGHFMARNINYFLPIWALVLGLFDRLFFFKSGYSIAERTAFAFFLIGHFILTITVLVPFTIKFPEADLIKYPVIIGFVGYGLLSFHKREYLWSAVKCLVLIPLSFAIYAAISFSITLIFFI